MLRTPSFVSPKVLNRITRSYFFVEFLQSSFLPLSGLFPLVEGLFKCLLLFLRIIHAQDELAVLLTQSRSFSLGLVQLRSQPSHLGVEGDLCLGALRCVGLQLSLRKPQLCYNMTADYRDTSV